MTTVSDLGVSEYHLKYGSLYACDGTLSKPQVASILNNRLFKGWLYLNDESAPESPKDAVQAAGLEWQCVPLPVPQGLTGDAATAVARAVATLPKPLMIQCSTATRASAALLLALGRELHLDAPAAASLAQSAGFRCAGSAPLMQWVGANLQAAGSPADGLLFRQLFDKESSTYSYLLADAATREAVLIDPVLEQVERDLALVRDLGLNLVYAVNTHCHADHVTGTGELKKRLPSVRSGITAASGAQADVLFADSDRLRFGSQELTVMATPGHTNGCATFYTPANGGMAFTGDTLLIRGCGRTDFQQGDAVRLYESVWSRIFTLPDSTAIFPAHDYKGFTRSSVAEEKAHNPRLTKTKEEFVTIMHNLGLPYPKKMDVAVPANLACGFQA